MFYAHFVLSKKGPLARIWLAAHWDKKLTKAHVFETNIDSSVEAIIEPKVKMALRTSGHLLLGVVRIYSRKAKYLLADCNEAFVKIKMAFRPGVVDLPEENREAAVSTITLPETFHDFDTTMADLSDIDVQAQFSVNQSRPEEITMREDLGNITLVGDDGFGDMGFDDRTLMQDAQMEDTLYKNPGSNILLDDDTLNKEGENDNVEKPMDIDFDAAAAPRNDFGDDLDDFEPAGVDDDDDDDAGGDDNFGGGVDHELFGDENFIGEAGGLFEEPPVPEVVPPAPEVPEAVAVPPVETPLEQTIPQDVTQAEQTVVPDQTTLVPNEAEAFALEPLDVTSIGTERKSKRKRKLVIDEQKGIASETMKLQLSDTSEIVTTLDLAPPTKKLMHWKETGGVEKLFALPGRPFLSKRIAKLFQRNLSTRPIMNEEEANTDLRELEMETRRDADPRHRDSEVPQPPPTPILPDQPSHLEDSSLINQSRLSMASRQADSFLAPPPPPEIPPTPAQPEIHPEEPVFPPSDEPVPFPDTEPSLPPMAASVSDDEDNDDVASLPSVHEDDNDSADDQEEQEIFGTELPDDPSAAEQNGEPQTAEDAEEQEERRWNKRTQYMMHLINRAMVQTGTAASFAEICARNNRKQVASKFYALLVLKKQQAVEVQQSEPYGDIHVTRGPKFEVVF